MDTFKTIHSMFVAISFSLLATSGFGQELGKWDEVVGKKVANRQGEILGYVRDSVIDLEHGRYVGVLVASGGFLGFGERRQVVPPGALVAEGRGDTLYLDMDKARFRHAPTFQMSQEVGPPQTAKVAEVYRYYGQTPYFSTQIKAGATDRQKLEQLGYIQLGTKILLMPVDNLQGKNLGAVFGFRDLNRTTCKLAGVIIMPAAYDVAANKKIVPPQALRYNLKHNRLRLNDHDQPFAEAPDFAFAGRGKVIEDAPVRPGVPPPPLVQGNSDRDKDITLRITNDIVGDSELSHYAKNIEVGTVKGKTTLRGRVQTSRGRKKVIAYATAAAGRGNVTSLLEVRPLTAAEMAIDQAPAPIN
ncbi:hypothetical protein BH09VER1_BH09VER1_31350 [soil metagenome]